MEKFGILNTISALAGGDITKVEEILSMPYLFVMQWLWRDKERYEFEKRLNSVYEREAKLKAKTKG